MIKDIKDRIISSLKILHISGDEHNIVDMGRVSDICIVKDKAYLSIRVDIDEASGLDSLRLRAEELVKDVPEIGSAVVTLTDDKVFKVSSKNSFVKGIVSFIAVASGKGGVGKSTTAVNIACSLSSIGNRVAILDADVHGPSIPKLLDIDCKAEILGKNKLKPIEKYGIKIMSIAALVDNKSAMIWRGPMVQSAVINMLKYVTWGNIDVMLIDMPPGTGDAILAIAQKIPLSGVIVVSTPQELALIDVRRSISMFQKLNVPIIGMIENMSYFMDYDTGKKYDILGQGGVVSEAEKMGIPFLESIPFDTDVRISSDLGFPIVLSNPDSVLSVTYKKIADRVQQFLEKGRSSSRIL
ncbi:Mrp/NBP35 family ATP-binding protein [Candidatus Liberibacter americanus]|nr:Mrp/NBP35 family ATP-binding protein [Candidatus Liberibacter americanus]